jgi:hypothetical protein
MMSSSKSPDDRDADVLDVHILDMAAHVEALLRSIREVQRSVLKLRGAVRANGVHPGVEIQHRLTRMEGECGALADAIRLAKDASERVALPPDAKV